MKFLLDTHIFLWFIDANPKLSSSARQLIEDPVNERLLSVASLWEMSIKASIGKLRLALTFPEMVENHVDGNAIELLHVGPEHPETVRTLPFHHKDPFDRLIIAQSQSENIPVLSQDEIFDEYAGVQRIG
uniref:PIN domain nuclease, a component of toxin-antitoxin system (PIN domain) n=1 Tax=Candidatus Kentrum sp. DK TaxID=2126562 RepID=A0A450T1Q0_9GAMM|nr:MAG: PIN domain nuclease, a component of toxin-antitoxin system (PIN domain) [Candidatus Kentron sp. DK]